MAHSRITVIGEGGKESTYNSSNSSFKLLIDDVAYEPAIAQEIEVESNQQQARTGTQCGTQRVQNTSVDPFMFRVQGICTNSDRQGELTARRILYDVQEGEQVDVVWDGPAVGSLTVSNAIVRQEEGLNEIAAPITNNEPETAFRFQIQLGEENNE